MPQTSLQQILSNLKNHVRRGDNVRDVASSGRINAIMDALWALARGENLVSGNGLRKKQAEGYFILSADTSGRRGVTVETETPFQVVRIAREEGDAGLGDLVGVVSNSHLFNSEDRDTYEEDNTEWGLLEDDRPPGDSHAWASNYLGDKIWLKITLDPADQSITAIDVEHGVGWDRYPDPIFINIDNPENPFQEFYYQIIAEVTDPEQDPRPGLQAINDADQSVQITQLLFTNLMMATAHTTADANEPGLPLLVAMPWNGPGTNIDGSADEIPPEENLMTPWQYGDENDQIFAFAMFDASVAGDARILIMDGDVLDQEGIGHTPEGMGIDDFIADGLSDGDAIFLRIPHDEEWNVLDPVTIEWESEVPPDEEAVAFVEIGYVEVIEGASGTAPLVIPHNTVCGDYAFEPPETFNRYAFEIIDRSDNDGARVLILDGDVIDQDGIGHTPQDMGNDDFIADGLNDGDTFYLAITHDEEWNVIGTPTVEWDQEVPADTEDTAYIEIGYVAVEVDDDGTPQITMIHNTVCGDLFFEPPEQFNRYAFEIIDRSDGEGAKVLVLDGDVIDEQGEGHTPDGMGNDDWVRQVDDGDTVYLAIFYNQANGEIVEPVNLDIAQELPDDQPGVQYVEIGYVDVELDDDGTPQITMIHNTILGDYFFKREFKQSYAFQMFDASGTGPLLNNPAVLIMDGDVLDKEGVGHTPDGMGNDDYILPVADGDSIYLVIPHDDAWNVIDPVTIGVGPEVPDDTSDTMHVEIGYVEVRTDQVPGVIPHNTVCGDWSMDVPPETLNDYNFEIFDASIEGSARVLILDGVVYGPNNDGGVDPEGMPSNDSFIIDGISDEDEIWLQINWSPDDPPTIESVTIEWGAVTPDDEEEITHITIGNVQIDSSGDVPIVSCRNELCGDAAIEIPPFPPSDKFVLMADEGGLIWQETVECACVAGSGGDDGEP